MKVIISVFILVVLSLQAEDNNVRVLGSLMWQDEPYTYFEKQARYDQKNYSKVRTWESASSYCKKLTLAGHSDWKLPNKSEIKSIVDKSRRPAIKKEFKNVVALLYWTSIPHESISDDAYVVSFSRGIVTHTYKSRNHYVRCVREIN